MRTQARRLQGQRHEHRLGRVIHTVRVAASEHGAAYPLHHTSMPRYQLRKGPLILVLQEPRQKLAV